MNVHRHLLWLGCVVGLMVPASGMACTLASPSGGASNSFTRHLVGPCTPEQRRAMAVPAHALVQAIREGRDVDLVGVEIDGALHLDQLPEVAVTTETVPVSAVRTVLLDRGIDRVRVVPGGLSIVDSEVPRVLATNLVEGAIVFQGPVVMTGTAFHRSVDFSKAVFLQPVDFSQAIVLYEAFFIGARFERPAKFEHVAFGTHTRFHRAVFVDAVRFTGSRFQGLAEFLEIRAARDADFSHVVFVQGTGFSGGQFHGRANFSHARFEQTAFFRFTTFRSHVDFSHVVFEGPVDFRNAVFGGTSDFTDSAFAVPPGPEVPIHSSSSSNSFWPWLVKDYQRIVIFVLVATGTIFVIWGVRRA